MELYDVFNQILIIFLIMIVGYASKRLNAVTDGFCKGLVGFVTNISLPALIISSMEYDFSPQMLVMSGKILIISGVAYLVSILLANIITAVYKMEDSKKAVFKFMIIFANVGFMGIPVINAIYGSEGVFYTAIYNMPFNFLVWTLGVIILKGGREKSKITLKSFVNPGTVSVLIGFIIFIFSIKLPGPIGSTIDMIGSLTTPLSMFYIGTMLAGMKIKHLFSDKSTFIMSIFRLIILPAVIFLILKPFVSNRLLIGVPIVLNAMPAAANSAIMAGLYDGDVYTASQGIFISTMLSIATIPLLVLLLARI